MSVQNKPDYKIFASGAKPGEVVDFPDVLRGWGVTLDTTGGIPPLEFFNSASMRLNEWLMYLTQRGIAEWDASVDYPKNAMTNHAGVYYVSLKATKGEQPNNSQLSWKKLEEFLGVNNKLDKGAVVQTPGQSTTNVMSQKAVTDLANTKQPAGNYANLDSDSEQYFNGSIATKKDIFLRTGNKRTQISAGGAIGLSPDNITWYSATFQNKTGTIALTLDAIGGGNHEWYDMSSQRKLGVVYNNTTGKPIEASIYCKSVHIFINSIRVAAAPVANRCNISVIIPTGGTISVTSQENSGELVWWSELR